MFAHLYARYSTDRQNESSIADQLRVTRAYCESKGWKIAGEHTDEGISGAALGNRPGVKAVLAAVRSGDALVVMDLFRLSRSQDVAPLIARLAHRGVRVVGVQDGFDSQSRTARMQAGLSGIMSEEFRMMVADRTRSALSMRASIGLSTGGRAYGYAPGEAEVVREAFARFADGESLKQIVSDFNRRGIPSPGAEWRRTSRSTHGRWLVSALHAMLRNERYIGRLVYNRSQWRKDPDTGRRTRVPRPESEWIVREIEPVVDREIWDAAQARFRPGSGRGGVPRYLLSGLLECELCGSKMIVVGGSQRRYVCSTRHAGGPYACENGSSVPREIAEEYILAPVLDDMLSPEAIEVALAEMRSAAREEARDSQADREIRELERLVREGVLSAEVAAPALQAARQRAQRHVTVLPTARAWRDAVQRMRDVLRGDDVATAREVLREILGPIRVRPGVATANTRDGHVVATLTGRQVLLATGTGGIRVGSGGAISIHIPTSSRRR